VTTVLIQLVLMSTRAVVSGVVWGQFGPLLSVETSNGTPPAGVVKYGAPESYRQALVSRAGPRYSTRIRDGRRHPFGKQPM